ncbi:MAG: CARDB domain-containing protein [Halobacteriales archaeon]
MIAFGLVLVVVGGLAAIPVHVAATAPAQSGEDLRVTLGNASAEPGDTIEVPVSIASATEEGRTLLGYDMRVSWDSSVLDLVEVRDTGFAEPVVNSNESGTVQFNAVSSEGEETPLEPAELVFEVVGDAGGQTPLTFDPAESEVSEADGDDEVGWVDGSVEVTSGGDAPRFAIDGLTPGDVDVEPGEEVPIETTVENEGSAGGTATVELVLDGEVVQTEDLDLSAGESADVAFDLVAPDEPGTYSYGVRVDDETRTATLVAETPVDGLTLRTQAVGERPGGDAGVLVHGVDPSGADAVALTYGESSVVAGTTELEGDEDSGVVVPMDDLGGVPGSHTAVVVAGGELTVGEPLPSDAEVLEESSGTILETSLVFEDQAVAGTLRPVEVAETSVRDGDDGVGYRVSVQTDDGDQLGTSDVLEGTNEEVLVELDEPLPDTEQALTATMVLDDGEASTVRALDGDRLRPVRATATVQIHLTRQSFDLSVGSVRDAIGPGEELEVPVTISNTGEETVSDSLTLEVDGEVVTEVDVEVPPGEETTTALNWTAGADDDGTVNVTASLLNRSDGVSVTVEEQGTQTPSTTPSPTGTDEAEDQPGFGLVIAAVAIATAAGAIRRRR